MGINAISTSGHTAYGIKEYVVDTAEDVKYLPIDIPMGSTALVIENSTVWCLNGQGEWKQI